MLKYLRIGIVAVLLMGMAWLGLLVLPILGLLVLIAALAFAVILMLSNLGAYFTIIPQGSTAFINAGDSLKEILPNVGGYAMSQNDDLDGRKWLIPEKYVSAEDKKEGRGGIFHNAMPGTIWFQKWLWERFGVKFISLFWPHTDVHEFDLREGGRRRIRARTEIGADAPLRSRVVDSAGDTLVKSLLFLTPRPVYIEGVELGGDNSKINLLLLPVFQQVIPSLPVYYLKGDFYSVLDAAIEAAIVDFFANHRVPISAEELEQETEESKTRPAATISNIPPTRHMTYADWVRLSKTSETSPLEKIIRNLNVSQQYLKKLETEGGKAQLVKFIKNDLLPYSGTEGDANTADENIQGMIPDGIVSRFGFAVVSVKLVEWEAHKTTEALAASLLAKQTEFHTAQGLRQKAFGERDAKIARAAGESSRTSQIVKTLIDLRVTPDVAAGVLETQLRTENIGGKDSKITTYIEGGEKKTHASILVPTTESPTPRSKEV